MGAILERTDLIALQQSVIALFDAGRYKESIDLAFELKNYGQLLKDAQSIDIAYYQIALASYYNGDIHQAFTYIVKHDEYARQQNNIEYILKALMLNYLLYSFLESYHEAEIALKEAIQLAEQLNNTSALSKCYKRLAIVFNDQQRYIEAEQHALKSLQYAKEITISDYDCICNAYIQLIYSYIGQEKFDYAACYMEDLISIGIENYGDREKASALNAMGKYYFACGDYEDSISMYFNAKAYAESSADLKLLADVLKNMIEQCEMERNYMLGYEIQREYIETILTLNKKELTAAAMELVAKKNIAEFERRATLDPLTGIYNRSYLEQTTNRWLQGDALIGCIAFDIDRFKQINDQFGHLVGDEVLKSLVAVCNQFLPTEQTIFARYGGDEFVIVTRFIEPYQIVEMMYTLMEEIRDVKVLVDEMEIMITVSIGIAINTNKQLISFESLFKVADDHLYYAKQQGRNRIYFEMPSN